MHKHLTKNTSDFKGEVIEWGNWRVRSASVPVIQMYCGFDPKIGGQIEDIKVIESGKKGFNYLVANKFWEVPLI